MHTDWRERDLTASALEWGGHEKGFDGLEHVEPKNVQAINETTFLATYAVGIMAEEIGAAIEKIENWLSKPVVITCNEVTVAQLPHVLEHVWHITGVESVVFNKRIDDLQILTECSEWLLQHCSQSSGTGGH